MLELFDHVLSRACISIDHPRFLSFIPSAPTEAATLFDLVVGASSIYGGSWLEGAGAVYAENQALALDLRSGRFSRRCRWSVRPGRHDREPLRARRGAAHGGGEQDGGRPRAGRWPPPRRRIRP